MKKSVIIIIGVLLCVFIIATIDANAQNIDKERMDRDLLVASNVLKSVLNQSSGAVIWGNSRNVEATYMDDYGVIRNN